MLRLFQRQAPDQAAHFDIAHDGEIYRVALKRVVSSRRFTLRVRTATRDVLLTIPSRFVAQGGARVCRTSRCMDRRATCAASATRRVRAARRHPLRGVDHRIVHRPGERGVVWLEASERGPLICVTGERPHVARRVADFLKREARKDIEAAVARHSKKLGVKPRRIVLRDTVSRWGSCSSTGGLNFSWRLILAPPFVLDYLAAHEVAHFVHMNHSPMFWKLANGCIPKPTAPRSGSRSTGQTFTASARRGSDAPSPACGRRSRCAEPAKDGRR